MENSIAEIPEGEWQLSQINGQPVKTSEQNSVALQSKSLRTLTEISQSSTDNI